ncbi:hypothetical protein GOP47_0021659 [Adiantum capillus-veneris]|uniref:Tryptophan synthase beta chain-like PALP domain-containing protein n=1 Tax=Adiantum capillus-veneris TaxID=13818 RepID=A0A9D4Z760_ADICA|nr:hypothetical protein GOP47_0021659 [Adiantum capillus-veneris]
MAAMQAISCPSSSLCKSSFLGSTSRLSRVASAIAPSPVCAFKVEAKKGEWLPGLASPAYLEGNLADDNGFDPLSLAEDPANLKWYVQAELQNGRWAMLGVAGMLFLDLLTKIGVINVPAWYDAGKVEYFTPASTLFVIEFIFVPLCGGEKMARHQLIGCTPLVELKNIASKEGALARIVGKLEWHQPLSSVKDGIALLMIEDAESLGLIKLGLTTLIEPTNGNTAISLAFVGIHKGYKVVPVMSASYSLEGRMILGALGAEIYLTNPAVGIAGLFAKAEELVATRPNSYMLNQAMNTMNPGGHFQSTGPEIWKDTVGKVDIFMAGVGDDKPAESPVLSGGCKGPHKIHGIGPGFIPATMDVSLADEIVTVSTEESMTYACQLAKEEGLLAGISSGTAVAAALKVSKRPENASKLIVTILPSGAERDMTSDLFAAIREECENIAF